MAMRGWTPRAEAEAEHFTLTGKDSLTLRLLPARGRRARVSHWSARDLRCRYATLMLSSTSHLVLRGSVLGSVM